MEFSSLLLSSHSHLIGSPPACVTQCCLARLARHGLAAMVMDLELHTLPFPVAPLNCSALSEQGGSFREEGRPSSKAAQCLPADRSPFAESLLLRTPSRAARQGARASTSTDAWTAPDAHKALLGSRASREWLSLCHGQHGNLFSQLKWNNSGLGIGRSVT